VQACLVILSDIGVAFAASFGRIRESGIFNYTFMRCLPVGIIGISSMAFTAAYAPMVFIFENVAVDPYSFMRGQRLHFAASSFTF
jgi:hypothetical protein